jgi:hypothetical protein
MEQFSMDDLLNLLGQKEAVIAMLSRRLTALIAENQALKMQAETATPSAKSATHE